MHSYLVQATSKLTSLARSGQIARARKLFDEMPQRDTITWNAMLSGYSQLGLFREALSLFNDMRISGVRPDNFSFTSTLSACAGACELRYGQKVHALVVVSGYVSSLPVSNSLIDVYGKCFSPCSASRVFEEMGLRNEVSWCSLLFAHVNANELGIAGGVFDDMPNRVNIAWNTMIAGHARCGDIGVCFSLFKKMQEGSFCADQWTLSALMNACAESQEPRCGGVVHCLIVKSGWGFAVEVNNSILSFYASISSHDDVVKAFDSIESRTQVSWNSIIDAHMKIGDTQKAFIAFQQMPERNVVSWTSMITGYARNGHGDRAISIFVDMIRNGLQPDNFTLGAVLHASSILATLGHGKMVHSFAIQYSYHAYAYAGNGLVNMYAKCGDIDSSNQAFDDILVKDIISWNTMLLAFGLHGWASRALQVHEEMLASGLNPDKVTFIALLMTCSHSGLIDKGQALFESMTSFYGLSLELDHVACMVDVLARGEYIKEATELTKKHLGTLGMKTRSSEALFGASFAKRDVKTGIELGKELKALEPENEMGYVVLSNLYCLSGQWKEAEMVRKAMVDQGVKKMPGCSWIEVRNKMTTFVAGSHPKLCKQEICSILNSLEHEMKNPWSFLYDNGIT